MKYFSLCAAMLVAVAGISFGQEASGNQRAMAVLAGMRADLSQAQADNKRLNARIEELEERLVAQDRRIEELNRLCVSLNEMIQNQDKANADRLKALQTAMENDQLQRQQDNKKLTQELTALLKNNPPKAPSRQACSGEYFEYTVASGDTLSSIAKDAGGGVTIKDIMDLNGLKSADKLRIGQVLKIPVKK